MRQEYLLWISYISCIISLILLFYIAQEIPDSQPRQDDSILIVGTVEDITYQSNLTRLSISYNETVDVLVYEMIDLKKQDTVRIIGKKQGNIFFADMITVPSQR